MTARVRNRVIQAFAVVGVALLATSTAFACTNYKGYLDATGNGTGNTAQRVAGTGSGMNWCVVKTPTVKVATGQNAGSLTLVTGRSNTTAASSGGDGCGTSTQMRESNGSLVQYTTAVTDGAGYMPQGGGSGAVHNCHGTTGTKLETNGTVDANGVWKSGNGTNTINFTAVPGPQSVCIYGTGRVGTADAIAINFDAV